MAKHTWIRCPECEGDGWHEQVSGDAQCQRCGGTGRCKLEKGEKMTRCARCRKSTSRKCICGRLLCLPCTKVHGHCGCEIDEVKKVKR